ncbi:peptidase S8/S53 domain-containing protein, partial [Syncephalis plumigaleata]
GVAPEAQLTSYNVFGSQGSTSTSTSAVLSALNMAINQGARVITLPEIKTIDASAIELKNLIINAGKKGIVMIVAASDNNYLNNNHFSYTGLPVIPVGGYRTPYQLAHWFEELGTKKRIGFTSTSKGLKENGDKVDIVVFDSVQAIEDLYTKKSAHKMILVMSYTITNANLLRHAKSLNALGVITTRPDTRTRRMIYPVPLFVISKNDAEYIRSRKGQSKFNFTNQRGNILEEELPSLDRLETLDNVSHIPARPDILGPSTNVLAPSNHGTHGYTMFNGVFAAIAYVTGAVALLIQSNVDNTNNYLFVKGSLQNYATPLLFQGIKVPVSVIFQGAGAINVRDTLMNSLAVAPSLLDSNTQERTVKHAVAISSLEIIPNFSFSSASSIYILQHNSQTHLIHPNSGGANTTVTVSPPVPTNQYGLTQFEVTINVAANIPPKSVLRYSGFILIHLTPPLIGQYTRKLICLPYNGKISG